MDYIRIFVVPENGAYHKELSTQGGNTIVDNAINVTEWNYLSIFKLLDKEKKEVICLKLLQFISPIEKLKKDIENKIAQFSNMRSQTVSSLPIEKKGGTSCKDDSAISSRFYR